MTLRVSVVVATRQRAELLDGLLDALLSQELDGGFDVVVVDDGSSDGTGAVLERRRAAAPTTLHHLRLPTRSGPAAARNLGWRATGGTVVVFTDDDCVPQPGWLAALADLVDDGADVVQGRTEPDPAQADRWGPFSRSLEIIDESGFYQTCNIAYRRVVLEALDGFDERFRFPAGEDTDLAWRAKAAGARTRFEPAAVVFHAVRPSSWLTQLRDTPRWEGVVLLVKLHPELRTLFHRPHVWRASHPTAGLAAVGGVVALLARGRWRLVGAALVVPHLRFRWRRWPLPGSTRQRIVALPLVTIADVVEVAVLARASVRHRSLLL